MPDVELQKSAVAGACSSTTFHVAVLRARFSGPCSCTMSAAETAVDRSGARVRALVAKSWSMTDRGKGAGAEWGALACSGGR